MADSIQEPIRHGQILIGPQFNEPMRVLTVGSAQPGFRSLGLVGQLKDRLRVRRSDE